MKSPVLLVGFLTIIAVGCGFTVGATGCSYNPDACGCDDAGQDATCVDADAGVVDGPVDAPGDAPGDAFACMTHAECLAMEPGTCCVDPGPMGHCSSGIVIAGACYPQ